MPLIDADRGERSRRIAISASPSRCASHWRSHAEPVGMRNPAILYGVGNILENAVDFARDASR
jgi:hypothetical protein